MEDICNHIGRDNVNEVLDTCFSHDVVRKVTKNINIMASISVSVKYSNTTNQPCPPTITHDAAFSSLRNPISQLIHKPPHAVVRVIAAVAASILSCLCAPSESPEACEEACNKFLHWTSATC